ncbi:hypothetical protein [Planotetraspora phitsanulokensis]|uniref:Uncharacterized protein n=1 Tax=Planotetraspora phitsanulokensis TaxID=575192 RepID=A0A8J3UD08_9ACTN|nr:hypothetical protein [Planotetraspora phitsanulokensis]GII42266.1 hypothetical protein Pph01_72690 [Planotetraspora phitsanulokensis]
MYVRAAGPWRGALGDVNDNDVDRVLKRVLPEAAAVGKRLDSRYESGRESAAWIFLPA